MDYSRPELADRLAADYVAGTLRGPARRRFESLLPAHPVLRGAVRAWEDRLMPMTASVEPQAPPARVWDGIQARIGGASPAPAPTGWWSRLAVWRGFAGVASAAALGLAVLLSAPDAARPPIVVVLNATGPATGGAVPASFVASITADGRAMVTRPITTVSVSPDRALELWAVPAQGDPRSLGLISADGTTIVKRGKVLENTAALAVTLEPPSGSPTGKPTGPIVYLGKLQI
jgi:anti-sigma-K factor RskA